MKEESKITDITALKPTEVLTKVMHLSPKKQLSALRAINTYYANIEKNAPIESITPITPVKQAKAPKAKQSGDCCPICGSIEYYQSGTCKSCRSCGFAGGCG